MGYIEYGDFHNDKKKVDCIVYKFEFIKAIIICSIAPNIQEAING